MEPVDKIYSFQLDPTDSRGGNYSWACTLDPRPQFSELVASSSFPNKVRLHTEVQNLAYRHGLTFFFLGATKEVVLLVAFSERKLHTNANQILLPLRRLFGDLPTFRPLNELDVEYYRKCPGRNEVETRKRARTLSERLELKDPDVCELTDSERLALTAAEHPAIMDIDTGHGRFPPPQEEEEPPPLSVSISEGRLLQLAGLPDGDAIDREMSEDIRRSAEAEILMKYVAVKLGDEPIPFLRCKHEPERKKLIALAAAKRDLLDFARAHAALTASGSLPPIEVPRQAMYLRNAQERVAEAYAEAVGDASYKWDRLSDERRDEVDDGLLGPLPSSSSRPEYPIHYPDGWTQISEDVQVRPGFDYVYDY